MNRKLLEPKERELISKILDFRFEIGTTIVCLKDIFAKITFKLDAIPPVYKDNFDIEELKGLRHDVKYFSKEMGVELGNSNYPDGHPLYERQSYFKSLANWTNRAISVCKTYYHNVVSPLSFRKGGRGFRVPSRITLRR